MLRYIIWTLSLWDLKPFIRFYLQLLAYIWTLSLWDLKQFLLTTSYFTFWIWTLSLWDLKLTKNAQCKTAWDKFELYPYGIWNEMHSLFLMFQYLYLNFIPMGFETSSIGRFWRDKANLNFIPMGFETSSTAISISNGFHLNFIPMGFETLFLW